MCLLFCYWVIQGVSFKYHHRNVRSRVSVSNFQVSVSAFMTKSRSRSRLEIWAKSRSRRLRARLHHWSHPWSFYYCVFTPLTYGFISLLTSHSWWTMHWTSRQEVAIQSFTSKFLYKLDFCQRRFNWSWCLICSNYLHYILLVTITAHTSVQHHIGVRWIFPLSGRKNCPRRPTGWILISLTQN